MRILISGASGFIGRAVVNAVAAAGHNVIAITRSSPPDEWCKIANLEIIECDILSAGFIDAVIAYNPDIGVHLAAQLSGELSYQNSLKITEQFLEAAKVSSIKRLINVSSLAVYRLQDTPAGQMIDETAPVIDLSHNDAASTYAKLKRKQEDQFNLHSHETDQETVTLRPGIVYNEHTIPPFHAGIFAGPFAAYCTHSGKIPLVHVDSLAQAIVCASTAPFNPGPFNIVDDNLPSQEFFIQTIKSQRNGFGLNIPWPIVRGFLNTGVAALKLAGLQTRAPQILTPQAYNLRFKPFAFSNAKLKEQLDWQPMDASKGIASIVAQQSKA